MSEKKSPSFVSSKKVCAMLTYEIVFSFQVFLQYTYCVNNGELSQTENNNKKNGNNQAHKTYILLSVRCPIL